MAVQPLGGDRFGIRMRGHELVVDQPLGAGGTDTGPTPTELFVAGLASCVAFYVGRFLARHRVCSDGLQVDTEWAMAPGRPARVGAIAIRITPPAALPPERLPALLAVAGGCTVHHSLADPPAVSIEAASAVGAA
jgi:uncharacterized OsmC-like protein